MVWDDGKMRNYLCRVSYLGAAYKGFERQKKYRSIQGELERALSSLLGEPSTIHGAGRTDAGVNAKEQTFSFLAKKEVKDFPKFLYAYNRLLPGDISVLSIEEKPLIFDARHSCSGKLYSYSFLLGEKDPFLSYTVAYLGKRPFDYKALKDALNLFVGKHDFKNFTSKPEDKDSFIRTIESITFDHGFGEYGKVSRVFFKSNGFMTYQIRIMMGAAFKVALGQLPLSFIQEHLDAEERHIISYKAAPEGLTLEEVIYG